MSRLDPQMARYLATWLQGQRHSLQEEVRRAVLGHPWQSEVAPTEAAVLGKADGLWAAFERQLWAALDMAGTPDAFLEMDAEARAVAMEAYQRTYRQAMGLPTETAE